MNKLVYTIVFGLLFLAFSCCSSSKIKADNKFQNNPPFKIVKAVYKNWVGGQPGVKGYLVQFEIDNPEIVLDTVYFRNMKTKLKKDFTSENNTYVGTFILPHIIKDYILHKDPKKEFGNEPPIVSENIPFVLNDNEAVISYIFNNKTAYYKVSNIIEIKNTSKY
ncbi:hypothetical protein BX611_1004 [Lutibacter oceani]|uniref:Lipoprotein n=1 Tax=Lutibacter oceani TaxID=1853311 RepID=A0A3D9RUQ0_9FLAO|nr:hypothetical protein [Lutibacter oceani]REE83709.1 hypothetical protein BX611_1004 [Lutibacter oceani]